MRRQAVGFGVFLSAALLCVAPAFAWRTPLQPYGAIDKVIVWKSLGDALKADALFDAGAQLDHPELFHSLIACMVDKDTYAATMGDADKDHEKIEVIEGKSAGCEGVVPNNALGMNGA